VSELCAMKGVSRACGHKWIKRRREAGIAGLEERSRAPHEHGNRTDAKWVEILLRLKHEHPSLGPAKLVEMMTDRDGNRPLAASTAGEILNRYGWFVIVDGGGTSCLERARCRQPSQARGTR
jgi:putative transposase